MANTNAGAICDKVALAAMAAQHAHSVLPAHSARNSRKIYAIGKLRQPYATSRQLNSPIL